MRSPNDLQPILLAEPSVPERDLWSSVLLQAIDDLRCGTRIEWKHVVDWILSPDFRTVCNLAGVCPTRTADKMRAIADERQPRKTIGNRARPVMCVETRQVWGSINECADHIYAEPQHLRRAIKWGWKIRGYRFVTVPRRRR